MEKASSGLQGLVMEALQEREREREREETIEVQRNSNHIYVHDYCSNNVVLHYFNLIDVDDFGAWMCKLSPCVILHCLVQIL